MKPPLTKPRLVYTLQSLMNTFFEVVSEREATATISGCHWGSKNTRMLPINGACDLWRVRTQYHGTIALHVSWWKTSSDERRVAGWSLLPSPSQNRSIAGAKNLRFVQHIHKEHLLESALRFSGLVYRPPQCSLEYIHAFSVCEGALHITYLTSF